MKLRHIVIAVTVLAALALVVSFVNRPAPPAAADARIGQPILTRAAAEQAAALRLAADGHVVELKKDPAGAWLVASYHDFPADLDKLSRFVRSLAETKVESYVSAQPGTVARLGFKDTSVRLLDAAGKPLLDLELGKTPDNRSGRFFRHTGESKAYLAPFESFLDTEPKNWADTTLLALAPDDIAKVELTLPDLPPVAAERSSKQTPFVAAGPDSRPLKSDAIKSLLGNFTSLRFTDTTALDAAEALAAKTAPRTIKLTTFAGKSATIALGRKPEEIKRKPAAPPKPDVAKAATGADADKPTDKPADAPAKPAEPEFETIPAGPVFAQVTHGDASAPVNALMAKRAFEVSDYIFTSLPQKLDDLFEPPTPPPPSAGIPMAAPAPGIPAGASGLSIPIP